MLIKCPECSKDISDTVPACPHCGYVLKAVAVEAEPQQSKKVAIFQYISLGAAVVALFTPRILVSVPCLVVVSAGIIALARREPRWLLSLASIGLGILIIGSGPASMRTDTTYIQKIQLQDWKYTADRDYDYVRGRVKNVGDKTVSYFKITAYYRDVAGDVIDTAYTNSGEDLHPGMAKEFEIMHKTSPKYKTVTLAVDEARTK